MKRTRFSEEQIIGILRENEAGAKRGNMAPLHHRQATRLDVLSPAGPGNGSAAIWRSRRFHKRAITTNVFAPAFSWLTKPHPKRRMPPRGWLLQAGTVGTIVAEPKIPSQHKNVGANAATVPSSVFNLNIPLWV
jgi:hypothetical protein